MQSPILVGAVVYDPKVVVIWDIIKEYFINENCPMDYVFYSNYELMVEALSSAHSRSSLTMALTDEVYAENCSASRSA